MVHYRVVVGLGSAATRTDTDTGQGWIHQCRGSVSGNDGLHDHSDTSEGAAPRHDETEYDKAFDMVKIVVLSGDRNEFLMLNGIYRWNNEAFYADGTLYFMNKDALGGEGRAEPFL